MPTKKTNDGLECTYTPTQSGPNCVKIEYNGKELPKSPYAVHVTSEIDITKVAIKGLERRKLKILKNGHDREWLMFDVYNWLRMHLQKVILIMWTVTDD